MFGKAKLKSPKNIIGIYYWKFSFKTSDWDK